MPFGFLLGALAGTAMLGLVLVGFFGSLSARDLPWATAILLLSGLVPVMLYRALLRGWVERSHHPLVLRLLAAASGIALFYGLLVSVFSQHVDSLPSLLPEGTVPAGIFYWIVLLVLLLTCVVLADRHHAELR